MFWPFKRRTKATPDKLQELSDRADSMRKQLRYNPTTGQLLMTERYRRAAVDEAIEILRRM